MYTGTVTNGHYLSIDCEYQNSDNADELCDIWCQIQIFNGRSCSTLSTIQPCPSRYNLDPEVDKLCDLWTELNTLNNKPVPIYDTLEPILCIHHNNPTSADLLCILWCQLQQIKGYKCTLCPEEYLQLPQSSTVCSEWTELQTLQQSVGSEVVSVAQLLPVECIYKGTTPISLLLCDLYCKVQVYKGKMCVDNPTTTPTPCPYVDKSEPLLCELWEQLANVSNVVSTTAQSANALTLCPYYNNIYGNDLCDLWCNIQLYSQSSCVTCPEEYQGKIQQEKICNIWLDLVNLEMTNNTLSNLNKPMLVECPFQGESNSDILCFLWCQTQSILGSKCVICPEELQNDPANNLLCELYFQLQVLEEEMTQPPLEVDISCIYTNHSTSSAKLCSLWCEIQKFKGSKCIQCPEQYDLDPEKDILCNLYEELQLLKESEDLSTISSAELKPIVCQFENNPTSVIPLCNLWCEIQEFKGSQCVQCPEQYDLDPEKENLCNLYEELQLLQGSNNVSTVSSSELKPIFCQYEDNPTSSIPLCDLWCQIQEFKNSICIKCPEQYDIDPEKDKLCDLYEELQLLTHFDDASTVIPSDLNPVICQYDDNPTSAVPLCDLWCQIQEYKGFKCIKCPQQYDSDTEKDILCDLFEELQLLKGSKELSTISSSELKPVVCQYEDNPTSSVPLCDLWCQIQELEGFKCVECPEQYDSDPEKENLCDLYEELQLLKGSEELSTISTSDLNPVICQYEDNPTSSVPLCDLWCQIQELKGSKCVQCPEQYDSDPEKENLCDLMKNFSY